MELQELALRIRRGDRDALKTLISEYGVSVYQKAYQKAQDKALAREATRQTFAQLVTSLQEQTDMDGWELWLNALAKRNIETYCNIGADMAFLERQLDSELFLPATPQAARAAQAPPDVDDAARQFALRQKLEAERQYAAEQARLLQQRQCAAAQAEARQYAAGHAQYAPQYAPPQAQSPASLQQPPAAPAYAPAIPAEPPRAPQSIPAEPLEAPTPRTHRKRKKASPAETDKRPAWPIAVLLVLLCILLVWLVAGVIMSMGWLPQYDLGYEWFNAHILDLF